MLLFVNEHASNVIACCSNVPGSVAQFHGDESPQACWAASGQGQRPYLRAARIPRGKDAGCFDLLKFTQDYTQAQAILLDAQVDGFGGGGHTFNWSLLPPNVNAHLVLSGGLTAANVSDGITQVRPRCKSLAVDVSSGIELPGHKGVKDTRRMREFVAAVRQADQFQNTK